MFGTMISKLLGELTGSGASTESSRRRASRRFQAGLGLDGLEVRIAPADMGMVFGHPPIVQRFSTSNRDLITNSAQTENTEEPTDDTTTVVTDPVDLNPDGPLGGDGSSLIA